MNTSTPTTGYAPSWARYEARIAKAARAYEKARRELVDYSGYTPQESGITQEVYERLSEAVEKAQFALLNAAMGI